MKKRYLELEERSSEKISELKKQIADLEQQLLSEISNIDNTLQKKLNSAEDQLHEEFSIQSLSSHISQKMDTEESPVVELKGLGEVGDDPQVLSQLISKLSSKLELENLGGGDFQAPANAFNQRLKEVMRQLTGFTPCEPTKKPEQEKKRNSGKTLLIPGNLDNGVN